MAVVTTKSPSIINLDAQPIFANTVGEGADGLLRMANDSVSSAVGDSIGSIYRLVRVPTNAKIKRVTYSTTTAAAGAGAGDIDVAFSDSTTDGTQQQFLNAASPIVQITGPADNKLFGAASTLVTTSAAHPPLIDATFQGVFTFAEQNMPLWAVLVALGATQFSADPGGFFDLVFKLTTAITTAAGNVNMMVDYVE